MRCSRGYNTARLLRPLSRSSLLRLRAAKWRINPHSQFNRRAATAGRTATEFFATINFCSERRATRSGRERERKRLIDGTRDIIYGVQFAINSRFYTAYVASFIDVMGRVINAFEESGRRRRCFVSFPLRRGITSI